MSAAVPQYVSPAHPNVVKFATLDNAEISLFRRLGSFFCTVSLSVLNTLLPSLLVYPTYSLFILPPFTYYPSKGGYTTSNGRLI